MTETTHGLILPFPDQSPSFCHGFEAGNVWTELKTKTFVDGRTVRVENTEVLKAIAAHYGYTATLVESEVEGWLYMSVEKFKLSVVTP